MAFNRAGIEKAWNSVTSQAAELRQGAAGMIEGAKNSKAGGMVSDSAAAIHGIGLHTLGGAAMGGTINAAAYANDGHAFTSADSGASAFLSGAGYGAAAGMGLGMMHAKKYAAYNAAKRTNSKLKQGTMTKATNELEQQKMASSVADMNAREMRAEQSQRSWADSQANARMQAAQRRNNGIKPTNMQNPDSLPGVNYKAPNVNKGNLQLLPNENLQMPAVDFNAGRRSDSKNTIMSPNYGFAVQYHGPLLKGSPHNVRQQQMRPK